ncbi:MAG: UDP-3-O-(3-hydroxymyristoyl)glucosamine N-acyltransferase [Phycisphaerales bacterium]|nr:UDP-3-O-(3-hydroxymyristoyl)glucosamine N-acyltransferase [Phycisphaerales bacterium]
MIETTEPRADGKGLDAASGGLTAASIAVAVGGELVGPRDLAIRDASGLEHAGPGSLSFIRSAKFAAGWASSKAAAALVSRGISVPGHDPSRRALIIVDNADLAMVKVLSLLKPPDHRPAESDRTRASVDPTASIGRGVTVGINTVIGPRARIGDGCVIHANVTIGADVTIGPATTLHPGVVVYDRCTIGAQCTLHAGVVIGADGFGYVPDPQGRGLIKVPHVGTVEIGNAVEIGANSCIDRGKFGATTIGDGSKIDNLVQVGHNVRVGRSCIVCGMTGIGGSAIIEDGAVIAGQVGIQDGRRVGARATISAMTGVMSDVPAGQVCFGIPAAPITEQMRAQVALRYLSEHMKQVKAMVRAQEDREATGP